MEILDTVANIDIIHILEERVETEKAKEAIKVADEVSDFILLHKTVKRNGIASMRPLETKI